jgi:hypothetical protein
MDPMAVSLAAPGCALFIDTRTLASERIAIPDSMAFVVIDSGVAHRLGGGGGYNQRRNECEEAARLLGVSSLRDVAADASLDALPDVLRRRVRHVTTENARVLEARDANPGIEPRAARPDSFSLSHALAPRRLRGVGPEVDRLVELPRPSPKSTAHASPAGDSGGRSWRSLDPEARPSARGSRPATRRRRSGTQTCYSRPHGGDVPRPFLFATGIEGSYPTIRGRDGNIRRIDEMERCGHYDRWREDFALVKEIGCAHLRWGPPYYRVHLGPGRYDWSFADEALAELARWGSSPSSTCSTSACRTGSRASRIRSSRTRSRVRGGLRAPLPAAPSLHAHQRDPDHGTLLPSYGWWNERLASDRRS